EQVLAICERGYGKRTPLSEFRVQNRGGKGIILIDASDRNGPVVGLALVKAEDDLVLMTDKGQMLRTRVEHVRSTGRNAQGVRVMNVSEGERVVALEWVAEREDETSDSETDDTLVDGVEAIGVSDDEAEPSESVAEAAADEGETLDSETDEDSADDE